jgi:hypothetical protein
MFSQAAGTPFDFKNPLEFEFCDEDDVTREGLECLMII